MKQFARVAVRTGGWGTYFGVRSLHGWLVGGLILEFAVRTGGPGTVLAQSRQRYFLDLRTDLKKSLTSGIQR